MSVAATANLRLLDGNEAAAWAARLARVQVFPAYPITPEAPLMTTMTRFIADGAMDCRFIRTESEHSTMAAAVGSSLGGARTFAATNSQGLLLMHEVLFFAAGLRLPIVMAVVNRAVSSPHCRFPDHSDAIAQEASGWIQLFCENNQDALDSILQAYHIAENSKVLTPIMVNFEGYILSHTKEPVDLPAQSAVDAFLPPFNRAVIDVDRPQAVNPATANAIHTEYKFNQHTGVLNARAAIEEARRTFAQQFGRDWGGMIDSYRMEGAQLGIVCMGSMVSTARVAVDNLRDAGVPVGLIKLRAFRPFPDRELRELAKGLTALAVVDRNAIPGIGGAAAREARAALAGAGKPVLSYIAGLAGRDVTVKNMEGIIQDAATTAAAGGDLSGHQNWWGLKRELIGDNA